MSNASALNSLRLLPFGLVGLVAAAIHYSIAVILVSSLGVAPQVGNVGGYLVALMASYAGQSRFTFPDAMPRRANFIRFSITSLCGFGLNALVYAALLRWAPLDYRVSLAIAIVAAAGLTYLLLDTWVFARDKSFP